MRYSNTVFYVYLRILSRNWCKFSSTALVLSNILHQVSRTSAVLVNLPQIRENFINNLKNVLLHLIFMRPKLAIWIFLKDQNRPYLM